ncbi:MAG: hypothetical protein WDN28_32215 [Chthoniobacter sp.]
MEPLDADPGWIFGIVFTLLVLGFLSFWPATRGHWSALLLAGPSVLLGAFLIWYLVAGTRPDQALPDLWYFFPTPFAVGLASLLFWASARHAHRLQASDDEEPP